MHREEDCGEKVCVNRAEERGWRKKFYRQQRLLHNCWGINKKLWNEDEKHEEAKREMLKRCIYFNLLL